MTEIGPAIDCVIEKVTDRDFIDSLKTLQKQRDAKKTERPDEKDEIIREYHEAVSALIDWYNFDRVRYTITDKPLESV